MSETNYLYKTRSTLFDSPEEIGEVSVAVFKHTLENAKLRAQELGLSLEELLQVFLCDLEDYKDGAELYLTDLKEGEDLTLYSPEDLEALLDQTPEAIQFLLEDGIYQIRVGGKVLIPENSLRDYLNDLFTVNYKYRGSSQTENE